ncbi:MAG TPA: hypothetical protein DCL08_04850 [Anaerolineaceae bacterium]|nr:hypothetical protein [Anaerolineaceae bacterium]
MNSCSTGLSKNVKVLSVHQPWAWLIVNGYKDVENRSWKTNYRGPLYIHAGKKFDEADYNSLMSQFKSIVFPQMNQFKFGGIIGIVDLVDCLEDYRSIWFQKEINNKKHYAWVLTNPQKVKFFRIRGQQGLFTIN